MRHPRPAPNRGPGDRVTLDEVFFDVVFVLTVTQLAHALETHLNWVGLGRSALILGLLWYLYTGYAWLNSVALYLVGIAAVRRALRLPIPPARLAAAAAAPATVAIGVTLPATVQLVTTIAILVLMLVTDARRSTRRDDDSAGVDVERA
ncbi:low temperature requirement protein A [Micromonospora sp. NPDC051227]|uniref:low temperature requirement protein A n=1 Tax=Micromonospora sp. NPDC051227 TaxID=3364285 RepID=UPI00378F1F79